MMPCSGGKQHSKCNGHELGTTLMNNDRSQADELIIYRGDRREKGTSAEFARYTRRPLSHLNDTLV
jgi:hypothetical protein